VRWIVLLFSFSCFASLSQKEILKERGYIWIKGFFSEEQMNLLRYWADLSQKDAELLLEVSQNTGHSLADLGQNLRHSLIVVPETGKANQLCRVEDMLTCYPDLHRFVEGTITNYISYLMDESYVLFKDKLNYKWPGGGAFTPHQDFPAYENFGPREHITAMVCIDRATIENGCLQIAMNCSAIHMQKQVLAFIEGGKNHGSIQPEVVQNLQWEPLLTEPGDLVLFSSYVPHYSEPNKSQSARRAMFFTHNRSAEGNHREAYYDMKRKDPHNPVFHIGTPTDARTKN
jgi:ectoine hydroxylase-related dioxygenase (phytanoyl-CoA dioxygenase family)